MLIKAIRSNMLQLAQQIGKAKAPESAAALRGAMPALSTGGNAGYEFVQGGSALQGEAARLADRDLLRKMARVAADGSAEAAVVSTEAEAAAAKPDFFPTV